MIRAILFDFDDTLGNREVYAYRCYQSLVLPYVESEDPYLRETILQDCMLYDQRGNTNKEYVRKRIEKEYGLSLPYQDMNDTWERNLWKYAVLFEDALETLEYLKPKYQLGIITNGNRIGQKKKIENSGLMRFFDSSQIIVSEDVGFRKPDPEIFLLMCERFRVRPEECVFVGDTYSTDILGAIRAGMTPVWMKQQRNRPNESGVIEISEISDLEKYY